MERTMKPTTIDPRTFRTTLGRFASGVTVITTVSGDTVHGMTANAFISVSLAPPLVLVAVDNRARLGTLLRETGRYGVSVLAEHQESLARHFAGRPQPGIADPFVWQHDMALVEGALAHLVCRVAEAHPAGDHTLFIGEVEYLDSAEGRPLLFYGGAYDCLEVPIHSNDWLMW
jgi:flavin reductase (DIM6/NTAB) family NADH-FMN oxidoreductase RutF